MSTFRLRTLSCGLVVLMLALMAGCPQLPWPPSDTNGDQQEDPQAAIAAVVAIFSTSLHGQRNGKATFYSAKDGFGTITGIPIEELGCKRCHAATYANGVAVTSRTYSPGCLDCHVDPAKPKDHPVTDAICLGCHGRQGAEQRLFSDVHRSAGMACMDCHTVREMHGDGKVYPSFLSPGASDVACEKCHVAGGSAKPPATTGNVFHLLHLEDVHCSACHVKSVSSCYNCHFETEVAIDKKRFFGQAPRTGFKMLMNYNGKVHTATFQALSYEGKTFVAIAPFFGHSITKEGISCGDCHLFGGTGNTNLAEYVDTGKITVTSWDDTKTGADRLVGPRGVIPVPPDWKTALKFAFLTYTGAATDPVDPAANLPLWDYLKGEMDGAHAPIGTPLTKQQMSKLIQD